MPLTSTPSLLERVKERVEKERRKPIPGWTIATDTAGQALPGPATPAQVASAEAAVGFPLPPLLAQLYTQIANGGLGPGYGLLPATFLATAYQTCQDYARAGGWQWPARLLPLCYWGCEVYECLECSERGGMVLHFDPDLGGPGEDNFHLVELSLARWLERWLATRAEDDKARR